MARPTRTNAEYFYHPASFRNDRRVKAIRARFGACGYGLLIMLIETLTDADNIELSLDEIEIELLAGDLSSTIEDITALIQLAEKVGLFIRSDTGLLKCPQLDEWLAPVFEKRNRSRAASLSGQKSNAPWARHTEIVFARDGNKCKHCAATSDLTLDHIIPRSAGGSDEITNLQTLCSHCNSAKGVKLSQPVTVITPVQNSTVQYSTEQLRKEKPTTSLRSENARKESEFFTDFWLAYPRKESKASALKSFAKLSPDEQAGAAQAAREWFGRRSDWIGADGTDFRPHPDTWLNKKRWQDLTEITITQTPIPQSHGNPTATAQHAGHYQQTRTAPSKFEYTDTDSLRAANLLLKSIGL